MSIYTLGYARWSLDEVEEVLERLNALLLDVRHSPYTSKPGFSGEELQERFPNRHDHVAAFGNVNYQGGPIELADPERGLKQIRSLSTPFILMCGCRDPEGCHRSIVAERIAEEQGGAITHLRAPSERQQPGLFDASADRS